MAFWQVTYGGITQDASAWGISNLKRKRKSTSTDKVSFKLDGTLFDTSPLPFAWLQPLSITRNGLPWFSGIVTQPEPKASGKAESIAYEISGPWYWLEKTAFQQQWVTISTTGAGLVTGTTTKSETILGQSLDGIKMNSGQVLREVLIYAQYAYQMIPFPSTVDLDHLPPAPATPSPFIIGTITPSITVPYMTVRDKSCADIIRQMLKYSPDAIAWFDYSTSPPTLNIGQRGGLTQRAIPLYGGPVTGAFATAFNPKPRYDLQVPVVVAKFQEKNEINGTSYASTTVDVYPPAPAGVDAGAWASQPRAWVQTIDLIGGHTTQQSTDIKVIARPNAAADTVAVNWAVRKQPWLDSLTTIPAAVVGVPKFDKAGVGVAYINTIIDPDDPLNDPDQNPNDITITADKKGPDCNQLVAELLPGGFPPWLQEDPNDLDCAKVTIEVHLNYTGTDPATAQYFVQDPGSGLNVLPAGSGVFIFHYPCKVTNAETQTYSQLTSWAASEPVPTGFAQALYNSLKLLHYEGTLEMVEDECSDQLPPGSTFNAIGGNPDWQTMRALVLEVTEDIDNGATSVQFGPPAFLSLGEMEQLFKSNLGVLPSWKLEQRTTGITTAGANVIGAQHYADTHVVNPPSIPSPPVPFPFQVTWRTNPADSSGNTFQFKVQLNSSLYPSSSLGASGGNNLVITGLDTWTNMTANDTFWLVAAVDPTTLTVTAGTPTIHNYGNGNSDYDPTASPISVGGIVEQNTSSPPVQIWLRKVIADSIADANGKPTIRQYVQTDLVIYNVAIYGYPAVYPYPL